MCFVLKFRKSWANIRKSPLRPLIAYTKPYLEQTAMLSTPKFIGPVLLQFTMR